MVYRRKSASRFVVPDFRDPKTSSFWPSSLGEAGIVLPPFFDGTALRIFGLRSEMGTKFGDGL